jgi:hypothetical protein
MDNADWQAYFRQTIEDAEAHHLCRLRTFHSEGNETQVQFRAGRRLINFGSNDYLGLRLDPRLAAAAAKALPVLGVGSGASPLVTGYNLGLAELARHGSGPRVFKRLCHELWRHRRPGWPGGSGHQRPVESCQFD